MHPADVMPSAAYQVFVNGKEIFVYDSPVPAAYCSFDLYAPATVTIKAARDLKWVDIRPLNAAIKFTFKDSTITFTLSRPQQLSIELNGSIRTPLFLFANPPQKNIPSKNDKNVQFFEGGKKHFAGIIRLKDNQSVYIEEGAVVIGVIEAKAARNIKVHGRGILDGTYNNRMNDSLLKANPDSAALKAMKGTYHRSMDFIDCKNVTVEGVVLHNSTTWQIAPIHCDSVYVNNVKIISDQASDDGIDIVRSKNVLIENSFFRTKDDCIVIKAHLQYPKSEAVDNVLARNNIYWNALWGNAIEIGFELNAAEIKNLTFKNSDIIHVEAGAAISIHNAGSGHVKNVVFDDIRIEDARRSFLILRYSVTVF
jgi:polygalacturonase